MSHPWQLPPPVPLIPEAQRPLLQQVWFHGSLSRQETQALLSSEGDFLVRNSQGRPGGYVLSVMSDGQCKHFIIQCVKVKSFGIHVKSGFPMHKTMPAFLIEHYESHSSGLSMQDDIQSGECSLSF